MAFDWGGAASGAAGGAMSGATAGSVAGPWGTLIGTVLGGVGGLVAGGKTAKKGKFKQTPNRFSPQQQQALNMLLQQGQQGLQDNTLTDMGMQRLQNPLAGFNDVENYAKEQFHGSIVPSIAERFTSLGGAGTAQQNSGLQGQLGAAGAGLASELAALRQQYGTQEQQNALQLLNQGLLGKQFGFDQLRQGLEPQFENYYRSGEAGIGPQLLSAGGNAIGNYMAGGGNFGCSGGKCGQVSVDKNKLQYLLQTLQSR